ncbi:mechanosensitive ion channel [Eikenella sp. S3360]|uniref:Mechanosensitive ion channel n=1 Tax=Eikenella glucosivorans TaxID=2766967 RepID=A0ABS0N9F1_9NEIS|nr:mechanosensitive ion channel domain-containing protein [Eikenella glucosivorans]MBH5328900.1 mechanosensitive ion channel [Eikenella glucosivorans]
MLPLLTAADNAEWLDNLGESGKSHLLALFSREEFGLNQLLGSLSGTRGWLDFALAVGILLGMYFLAGKLLAKLPDDDGQTYLLRHIWRRTCWPLLMLLAGAAALVAWYGLLGATAVWLRLLVMAARWMLLIRVVLAVFHSAIPSNRFSARMESSLAAALWGAFLLWASGIDDLIISWLRGLQFSVGSARLSLYTVLTGLLWVGVMVVGAMWLSRYIDTRLKGSKRLDPNLQIVLSKLARTILLILSVLIALPLVGIDLTVLSVFGGALGVGLGFGLQKIASNYVSGFIILGDRSVRPGDRLTVNGFTGYVTQITARFVVLRSSSGQEALIPNETFITSTVVNESYTGKSLWQSLDVQVAYHTDLAQALQILQEAAAAQERVKTDPPPKAYLLEFADNGVNLRLGFWVRDPENGFLGLSSAILLTVWQRFNEVGIEFPFPQREVRILNQDLSPDAAALLKAGYRAQGDTASDEVGDNGGEQPQ